MRKLLILAVLLGSSAPLAAQSDGIGRRVERLEKEMRAVQRKVFPGPTGQYFEPDIAPQADPTQAPGNPASLPITDLMARVDALESQLANLTNQTEQNAFRLRQLEERIAGLVAEAEARLAAVEAAAEPEPEPQPEAPAVDEERLARVNAVIRPVTGDEADDLYIYGFRLWDAELYPEAREALGEVVERFPDHRRASFAQNLIGRSYLDEGQPADAALAFHENYQKWPNGERAPDSLVYLGQALIAVGKPADACKVYAALEADYGATLSADLRAMADRGREEADCG